VAGFAVVVRAAVTTAARVAAVDMVVEEAGAAAVEVAAMADIDRAR